jgi:hypothetical protein
MRKRQPLEGQASLFDAARPRKAPQETTKVIPAARTRAEGARKWHMPEVQGRTVAEIRLRWTKRLTPAQVARVEAELSTLPKSLTQLGFGAVQVERVFVRRRRG